MTERLVPRTDRFIPLAKRPPLNRIVERVLIEDGPGCFREKITLSCGHVLVQGVRTYKRRRAYCTECPCGQDRP